ncbi:MAPK/MAK/MRK overlapping kinase isoform X2 [Myiozetetes cayanensis]|uniref:MAPK/MAK/MRK overlapping kinase isoform X2 n=1 Tax=Myiozetetes cayanensis TaxID=478635 RepID=UPI00215E95A0|nr:MAPK/MAK/MRK overlapping kinase isoform X2 [Myiozetetes cayanensis]XP_050193141.1 MAPK/MAK/MRK overlapping kinase isoform X2 [Myiozetetes cayanensis]
MGMGICELTEGGRKPLPEKKLGTTCTSYANLNCTHRVQEAVIQSGLALSSLCGSFLGSNELDQMSKIHDIIGTPAKTTLGKFKQFWTTLSMPKFYTVAFQCGEAHETQVLFPSRKCAPDQGISKCSEGT